jgi:hypothetical protein
MQAILVPLDNRPITYIFPQMVARIAGVDALMPPRSIMGSLQADSPAEQLNSWLSETLTKRSPQCLLVCADSIIYGGLISSRRTTLTSNQLLDRAKVISLWKKQHPSLAKVFVQSSIMRVSDNYDNTEEKMYWARFGREIFSWSEALHRLAAQRIVQDATGSREASAKLQQLEARIDAGVREDYLSTRRRNFQINKRLLDYAQAGNIDLLIYSQDDSAQYGLNVLEKQRLLEDAQARGLKNVLAYAGADEVLLTMLARLLLQTVQRAPSAQLAFSPDNGRQIISLYEGQTLSESVNNQLTAAGVKVTDGANADLQFIVHTSGSRQGDHIQLPGHPDLRNLSTAAAVETTLSLISSSTLPVVVCDVAYANGADPALVEGLLARPELFEKIWGYAGWNTSGNTFGSAIAMGVARWCAEQSNRGGNTAFKDALFVRLSDDWAYQACVRQELQGDLSQDKLNQLMAPHLDRIATAIKHRPSVQLRLPWQRSFEIEVQLGDPLHAGR